MTTPGQGRNAPDAGATPWRCESWVVWSYEEGASEDRAQYWITTVDRLIGTSVPIHRSRHAVTYHWPGPEGGVYVKVYRRSRGLNTVKQCFRGSMARRAAQTGQRLTAVGFRVPRVLAVAEERHVFRNRRAWVATAALAGGPVAVCLARLAGALGSTAERPRYCASLREKRAVLKALGREVARLHEAGFVAGDLVPSNVWVTGCGDQVEIVLLDHDRTRWHRYGPYWWRARRNLVQLNRIVLVGVSVTDRMRVFRAYTEGRRWVRAEARRRLPWIIAKTAERRRRCDKLVVPNDRPVDFRTLMRAGGPYDPRCAAQTVGRDEGPTPARPASDEER